MRFYWRSESADPDFLVKDGMGQPMCTITLDQINELRTEQGLPRIEDEHMSVETSRTFKQPGVPNP